MNDPRTHFSLRLLPALVLAVLFVVGVDARMTLAQSPPVGNQPATGEVERVIIGYRTRPSEQDKQKIKELGGSVRYKYDLIPAIAGTLPKAAVEALRTH